MTFAQLPPTSRMRWRRLDVPGREEATIARAGDGVRLSGGITADEGGVAATLRYDIVCDAGWRTRSALVTGSANGGDVRVSLTADGEGRWWRDGEPLPELGGALDVDLGFTPATNTLPIRRLALAVGETRPVRSAWLRFPELRLEPLEQTYTRESESVYRYLADVDGAPFSARLDVDRYGRVLRYEGLWEAEEAEPDTLAAGTKTLVVLFGPPAVGKMTVGRALSARTGFPLFHNHLTIEPLLELFPFGHPSFRRLSAEFRTRMFEEVAAAPEHRGLIFTYVWALDDPSDRAFVERLAAIFTSRGARDCYVELVAPLEERLRRNEGASRLDAKPSKRDLARSREQLLAAEGRYQLNTAPGERFFYPEKYLRLDVGDLAPDEAAARIVERFELT